MKKFKEKNPASAIRNLLLHEFESLETAVIDLELGSKQSLSNMLRRLSNGGGSFKSFTNIIDQLGYEVIYLIQPSKASKFPYLEFENYIYQNNPKKASRLLNEQFKNKIITEEEFVEFNNTIENSKKLNVENFKTVVTLSAKSISKIVSFNPKLGFCENLDLILSKELIKDDLYEKIKSVLDPENISKHYSLLAEIEDSIEGIPVIGLQKFEVEDYLLNYEKVWVKIKNDKIYDISKFFAPEALNELKLKKNQKHFKILYVSFLGLDIYSIDVDYKNKIHTATFTKEDGVENIINF